LSLIVTVAQRERPCTFCPVKQYQLGLCRAHYQRQRDNGAVSLIQRRGPKVNGRFTYHLVEAADAKSIRTIQQQLRGAAKASASVTGAIT
jgi:hypothetical protein